MNSGCGTDHLPRWGRGEGGSCALGGGEVVRLKRARGEGGARALGHVAHHSTTTAPPSPPPPHHHTAPTTHTTITTQQSTPLTTTTTAAKHPPPPPPPHSTTTPLPHHPTTPTHPTPPHHTTPPEFEDAVARDASKASVLDGTVHPLTAHTLTYLKRLFTFSNVGQVCVGGHATATVCVCGGGGACYSHPFLQASAVSD